MFEGDAMKWLETIGLRCPGSREKRVVMDLLRNMGVLEEAAGPIRVEVYQSALVESDLSIHIHGAAETFREGKSPLGLSLTHALRDFGLISHSVWVHEGTERKS
jgi:hypothetical protein